MSSVQGFLSNSSKFPVTIPLSTEFMINELTNIYVSLISTQLIEIEKNNEPPFIWGDHQFPFFQLQVTEHATQDASK